MLPVFYFNSVIDFVTEWSLVDKWYIYIPLERGVASNRMVCVPAGYVPFAISATFLPVISNTERVTDWVVGRSNEICVAGLNGFG